MPIRFLYICTIIADSVKTLKIFVVLLRSCGSCCALSRCCCHLGCTLRFSGLSTFPLPLTCLWRLELQELLNNTTKMLRSRQSQ